MKKIVYESNSGFTAEYARLLSEQTGIESFARKKANLNKTDEVVYLGWMCAGIPKGFKKAKKLCNIKALCIVGMAQNGSGQIEEFKKNNDVSDIKIFYLQGGFDINRLHGIYKFMMKMMTKTVGKKLASKPDKSEEEKDMLELMTKGGSRVSADNLTKITSFIKNEF